MMGKAEEFAAKDFDGFVAKPIQSAELDEVLRKYLKPQKQKIAVEIEDDDDDDDMDDYYSRPEVQTMMRLDFLENYAIADVEIKAAVAKGETEVAQRLAHTIASLARYMKEDALVAAAEAVESAATEENPPIPELETELQIVLEKIRDTMA
jgi:HPt (histidine-containing phosphotransfer) domain-containing protein